MIKTALKWGLYSLVGAALMGCSDGMARSETVSPTLKNQTSTSSETKAVMSKTITFDNDTSCIQKDAGDKVSLTLTDGTELVLPRSWLQSVELQDVNADEMATKLSGVSQIRFNLPVGEWIDECQETISAHIYPTDIPLFAFMGENGPEFSRLVPSFSPLYSFAKVSRKDLDNFFNLPEIQSIGWNDMMVQTFRSIDKRPTGYRSRSIVEQLKNAASIRVDQSPIFILETGRLCIKNDPSCIYYDIQTLSKRPKDNPIEFVHFYREVGQAFTLQVSKRSDGSIEAATLFSESGEQSKIVETMIAEMNKLSVEK